MKKENRLLIDKANKHNFLFICMHICMYVCMHVCMYICMYVYICIWMHVCMYVCIYAYMYVCMYVCMYIWAYLWFLYSLFDHHEGKGAGWSWDKVGQPAAERRKNLIEKVAQQNLKKNRGKNGLGKMRKIKTV